MLVRIRDRRPARVAWSLQRDVDDVFRRAFGFNQLAGAPAAAALEVLPDADGVTVRAELPGVDPAAIAIGVEGRMLTIKGKRSAEKRENGAYQLRERAYGAFSHALRLSDDLDAEAVSAEAKHGVLTVRIPKRAEAKPRQIEVTVS
ncbi:MAG TPA: Hsp20/alpha crystallin family protein [Candidatus Dormibacteraeota bacterium]|nr:Hsp20/alpha crystallin family protein [Candidatus Dormibacteraeota bacterium]